MHALTLRGVSSETIRKLKEEAREHGFSMNKWVCSLLAGRFEGKRYVQQKHGDLDHIFGSMTEDDCAEIDSVVKECRTIEKDLWV